MATKTFHQPTNVNQLSPVGYKFIIENLPNVSWFITSVSLPGVSLGSAGQATPFLSTSVPGETMTFEDLNVTFIVDEDLTTWLEIFDWITGLGFPENYSQYKDQKANFTTSDATLIILNSNMRPNYHFKFKDLFPTGLSEITFDSASTEISTIKATVGFKYLSYSYEKVASET